MMEKLKKLNIPEESVWALIVTIVSGYIIHLYAFTNIIPNADGMSRVYDEQQMTMSGRWFLHYASMLHGYIQAPALIGFLSVLFLGLATAIIVSVLNIKGAVRAALVGILFSSFPAVTYTYTYIFTASAYFFAVFICALSVYLIDAFTQNKKLLFAGVACILLALSMGIYQLYVSFAVSLCLLVIIIDILSGEIEPIKIFKKGLSFIGYLAVGGVLYYLFLQIFLKVKGISLSSYRNMNSSIAGNGIKGLIDRFIHVYKDFFEYMLSDSLPYNGRILIALNIVVFGVILICSVILLYKKKIFEKGKRVNLLFFFIALLIHPFAMNIMEFADTTAQHMRLSFVLVYIFGIVIFQMTINENSMIKNRKRQDIINVVGVALMCMLILRFMQIDNIAYTCLQSAHRSTESFMTTLVTRIESAPGYSYDKKVYLVGRVQKSMFYSGVEGFEYVANSQSPSYTVVPETKHLYYYLNDWINIPWEEPSEEEMIAISGSEEFQNMPLYPNDGSILVKDDCVIVRLSNAYTPKKPYEIEYENRK